MQDRIKQRNAEIFDSVVEDRRTIHRNPELAFEETETAAFVKSRLEPLGIHLREGVAQTGIVATIKGDLPGPTVSLRADMDALPITELTELPFASENEGKMHACGHDAHTASLIGTAKILHGMKSELPGTVRMLFQPSEEKLPGGAPSMIRDGALADDDVSSAPQSIFGAHVTPYLPVGSIGIREGMYMASADEFYVTVKGTGGHAATPHLLGSDAVLASAQIIVALQSIASRNNTPGNPTVVSVGRVIADGATNVIPETVRLEGTLRCMDEEWRERAGTLIERVVTRTAEAFGASAEVEMQRGYPALRNDPEQARFVRDCAVGYVGEDKVVDLDLWLAGEDFAFYLQELPGAFYRIGTHSPDVAGSDLGLHNPAFTIDEEALGIAPGFMAWLAVRRLVSAA